MSVSQPFRRKASRRSHKRTAAAAVFASLIFVFGCGKEAPTAPAARSVTATPTPLPGASHQVEALDPGPATSPPAGFKHAATLSLAVRNATGTPYVLTEMAVGFKEGSALTGNFRVVAGSSGDLPSASLTTFSVVVASNEDVCVSSILGVELRFEPFPIGNTEIQVHEIRCDAWPALLGG